MSFRIGLIADTHGLFDPAIKRHFAGVDQIIHAGDIGNRAVIDQLEEIAPVVAVSGNVDEYERSGFPIEALITVAGFRIGIRHVLYQGGKLTKQGKEFLEREQPDVCVFGHTHRPTIERLGPTLLINPGSAGPKRFTLPRSIGVLRLTDAGLLPLQYRLPDSSSFRTSHPEDSAQNFTKVPL